MLQYSRSKLLRQVDLWRTYLPHVTPHYAVKSNNNPRLLRWLREAGASFDCASPAEIRQALRAGADPSDILYANPCKSPESIRAAAQLHIATTVVDSPEELLKLHTAGWKGSTLIRLKVPDAGSAQPFSRKFGLPPAWIPEMMDILRSTSIRFAGWSFHVGSLCNQPDQFREALEVCALASLASLSSLPSLSSLDSLSSLSSLSSLPSLSSLDSPPLIIDIGGGFHPDPTAFAAAAASINAARSLFPTNTRWIGEPGRFMSAPVVTLRVPVIGVKRRHDGSGWIYTVDESVYGSFSNIPFDGQTPIYRLMAPDAAKRERIRATLFGRTCDSADCLATDIELPELRVGDVLEVANMGAYTSVSASHFNGFAKPAKRYLA